MIESKTNAFLLNDTIFPISLKDINPIIKKNYQKFIRILESESNNVFTHPDYRTVLCFGFAYLSYIYYIDGSKYFKEIKNEKDLKNDPEYSNYKIFENMNQSEYFNNINDLLLFTRGNDYYGFLKEIGTFLNITFKDIIKNKFSNCATYSKISIEMKNQVNLYDFNGFDIIFHDFKIKNNKDFLCARNKFLKLIERQLLNFSCLQYNILNDIIKEHSHDLLCILDFMNYNDTNEIFEQYNIEATIDYFMFKKISRAPYSNNIHSLLDPVVWFNIYVNPSQLINRLNQICNIDDPETCFNFVIKLYWISFKIKDNIHLKYNYEWYVWPKLLLSALKQLFCAELTIRNRKDKKVVYNKALVLFDHHMQFSIIKNDDLSFKILPYHVYTRNKNSTLLNDEEIKKIPSVTYNKSADNFITELNYFYQDQNEIPFNTITKMISYVYESRYNENKNYYLNKDYNDRIIDHINAKK